MLVIASFKHSAYLELALIMLEQMGISKDNIIVAPLDKEVRIDDKSDLKMVHEDGRSQYDKAFIFACVFMLLGAIYGYLLTWGPIIWALIGIVCGGSAGFLLDNVTRKKHSKRPSTSESEVVLIINCDSHQSDALERVLWNHNAIGLSKIANYSSG